MAIEAQVLFIKNPAKKAGSFDRPLLIKPWSHEQIY